MKKKAPEPKAAFKPKGAGRKMPAARPNGEDGDRPSSKPRAVSRSPAPRPKRHSSLTQIQHDALVTGGAFTTFGGLLILLSLVLPTITVNGISMGAMDLLKVDTIYVLAPAISFIGTALLVLSAISVFRTFRPGKTRSAAPLVQTVLSIIVSLMVILMIVLLQGHYEGQDAFYGSGAFLNVIGAILVMAGSLLIKLASGKAPVATKQPKSFSALAERSARASKGWEPPESSVKKPICPSCHSEMEPSWKACPACGYAFIGNDLDDQERL